jgi:hypothetical protein
MCRPNWPIEKSNLGKYGLGAPATGTIAPGPQSIYSNQDCKTLTGGKARHARVHFLR